MLNLPLPSLGAMLRQLGLRPAQAKPRANAGDTVMHWPPKPARVLGSDERHAFKALARAMALEHPKGFLLSQVPVPKLVRVPARNSYREWLARTGLLTVDFALCDLHGYMRVAVLLPVAEDAPRAVHRRERLLRVLEAAEVPTLIWQREWQTEDAALLRALFPYRLNEPWIGAPHEAAGPSH
jgi:hypothetical protein